ncbi:unnamed protein product [Effrenium voratum]|uniref:Beta-carotene isomerase D27-like C-terminal domain-containing protein n=1 Tax=Effrenium voratum TaxID=2562239 RepID=A0AA36JCC3_9DINO|nr:unnamed protein product [Effrenium voratum]
MSALAPLPLALTRGALPYQGVALGPEARSWPRAGGRTARAVCISATCMAVCAAQRAHRRKATTLRAKEGRYKSLEAFLAAQRGSSPATDPLGGPMTSYNDGPADLLFIAIFRQVMSGVAGWQSPLAFWGQEAYDGMLEVAHAQQWGKTLQETEDSAVSVIDNLLPEEGKARFRTALKPDKFGTELNAFITAVFFPFMVGKCEVEERTQQDLPQIPEAEAWNCAVKIEKCRWLERSGCVGMCAGLCKRPMQRMFGEVLGMPLSMEPSMEDLSCTMVFGKEPTKWDQDDLREQPCFSTCATARQQGACPKLT